MPDNFQNYISGKIKTLYRRRLIAPVIFLVVLFLICRFFPIFNIVFPETVDQNLSLRDKYNDKDYYIRTTISDLHFTGYSQVKNNRNSGYYYYYKRDNGNIGIIILSPQTCEEGLSEIESVTVYAKICYGGKNYRKFISNMSEDLKWTDKGLYDSTSYHYLSEPDYGYPFGLFLFIVGCGFAIYAVFYIIKSLVISIWPHLAPCCTCLLPFGNPKHMLAEADEELATLPQLATEDMFITEHYFIAATDLGIAFVPIDKILWIYKHSTLHKIFWYHFKISYTLHITADNHLYIRCPKNIKSDIDGIIDYLSEANHNILVGFSEENRSKIHEIQGDPFHIEKALKWLKKKPISFDDENDDF